MVSPLYVISYLFFIIVYFYNNFRITNHNHFYFQVLGLTSKLPTSNSFDMDAMEDDLTKRTHSIMMDALRETMPDVNLLDLSNENLDTISSSSVGSVPNDELLSVKSKINNNTKSPDALESLNIWSNEPVSDELDSGGTLKADSGTLKANNDSLLINFETSETSPAPDLPQKQRNYERVSSAFNDEPLIDLAINDNLSSSPTKVVDRQSSTISLISGASGLNAILQNAMVPSPSAVKNTEFQNPGSPVEKKEDPWRMSDVVEEKEEAPASTGFENDFNVPAPEKKPSPVSSQSGSVESNYAEYAERVKKSPGLKKKFGIDLQLLKESEKTPRKKSQGAWFKDKLSTIGRFKSTNSNIIKKNLAMPTGNGATKSPVSDEEKRPTSPRGTPLEASERSKEKSMSLISKNSLEQGK